MPRRKKSIQVREYEDRGRGITVPIMYNPNTDALWHEAEVQGKEFHHLDANEVIKWVRERVEDLYSVTWQKVIVVDFGTTANHSSSMAHQNAINFAYDRIWVGRLPSGQLRQCDWRNAFYTPHRWHSSDPEPQEEDRRIGNSKSFWQYQKEEFSPPCEEARSYRTGPDRRYYPYTDELWQGLGLVKSEIERIAATLSAMLKIEGDAYLMIEQMVAGMLLPAVATGQRNG